MNLVIQLIYQSTAQIVILRTRIECYDDYILILSKLVEIHSHIFPKMLTNLVYNKYLFI